MTLWLGILNVIDGKIDIIDAEIGVINGKVDIIDGLHDLPSKDSAVNVHIRDAVGNKTDGHTGTSIMSTVHTLEEHVHSIAKVYPELANPVQLQKDAGVWASYPATKTEIIPAGTIGADFDIHWIHILNISANGCYMVALYSGTAGNEVVIGKVPIGRSAVQSQEGNTNIITSLIPANTRISAGLSSENNAQDTLLIKLMYHEY